MCNVCCKSGAGLTEGEHLDKVVRRTPLERTAKEGKSPVFENYLYAPCYFP